MQSLCVAESVNFGSVKKAVNMKSINFFKIGLVGILITLLAIFGLIKAVEFESLDTQGTNFKTSIGILIFLATVSFAVTLFGGDKKAKSDTN